MSFLEIYKLIPDTATPHINNNVSLFPLFNKRSGVYISMLQVQNNPIDRIISNKRN